MRGGEVHKIWAGWHRTCRESLAEFGRPRELGFPFKPFGGKMEKKIMPLLRGCENSQALVTPAARPGPSRGMHSDRAPQPSALDFQPPRPPAHPPPPAFDERHGASEWLAGKENALSSALGTCSAVRHLAESGMHSAQRCTPSLPAQTEQNCPSKLPLPRTASLQGYGSGYPGLWQPQPSFGRPLPCSGLAMGE